MFDFLEQLRQKPERVRRRLALLGALCVAFAVLGVWLTVVYPDIRDNSSRQSRSVSSGPSPWDALGETISSGFSRVGEQFGELRDTASSFTAGAVYYNATTTATSTENVLATTTEAQ